MNLNIEVKYDGIEKVDTRELDRYKVKTHILGATPEFIESYEHVSLFQETERKNWTFNEDSDLTLYTTYYANRHIGSLILACDDNNQLQKLAIANIEHSDFVKSVLKRDYGQEIYAPNPVIQPYGEYKLALSFDSILKGDPIDIRERLGLFINYTHPFYLHTKDKIVPWGEYAAFFGSCERAELFPAKMGSFAERLRETAYAMEHGYPFLYGWTNVLHTFGGKGDLVKRLNDLHEQFEKAGIKDEHYIDNSHHRRHVQHTTPEATKKKAEILRQMADIVPHLNLYNGLRQMKL